MNITAAISTLQNDISQGPLGDTSINWILNVLFYVIFVVFIFYGQRIQTYVMIREVESSLYKLKFI